jgi:hypothetical protein
LPPTFTPVAIRRCVLSTVLVPGDGEWQVRQEQEATEGLDALVLALRRPAAKRATNLPCPLIAVLPPDLTLIDANGGTTRPLVPSDACGLPYPEVAQALAALSWRTLSETRIGRLRGQLELDTGCPGSYKPTLAIAAADGHGRSAAPGPMFGATPPGSVTVCRYRLDPTDTMEMVGSKPLAVGVLDTAATLTGSSLTRVVSALDGAPAPAACDAPQAAFALLLRQPKFTGPSVMVELAGCHRAADDDNQLRQLDAATVALIAAAGR